MGALVDPAPTSSTKHPAMTQSLIDFDRPRYPVAAGYRASAPETSREAAHSVDGATWRARALETLRDLGPMTADEIADHMGASILTIRPRITELLRLGMVHDTGARRMNRSHRMAAVWESI